MSAYVCRSYCRTLMSTSLITFRTIDTNGICFQSSVFVCFFLFYSLRSRKLVKSVCSATHAPNIQVSHAYYLYRVLAQFVLLIHFMLVFFLVSVLKSIAINRCEELNEFSCMFASALHIINDLGDLCAQNKNYILINQWRDGKNKNHTRKDTDSSIFSVGSSVPVVMIVNASHSFLLTTTLPHWSFQTMRTTTKSHAYEQTHTEHDNNQINKRRSKKSKAILLKMYSFDVPLNEWRANDAMKGTKQQYRERERGGEGRIIYRMWLQSGKRVNKFVAKANCFYSLNRPQSSWTKRRSYALNWYTDSLCTRSTTAITHHTCNGPTFMNIYHIFSR